MVDFNADDQKNFWNKRFQTEGHVWGDQPSKTAVYAVERFRKNNVRKVLIPGSGYGRNSRVFSEAGFEVTGIEISETACHMAMAFDPSTKVYFGSVLNVPFNSTEYDAIYCFNVLHLFYDIERKLFLEKCCDQLRHGGLAFFSVFSEKEPTYGKAREVEKDTFESRLGRPTHYFTDADIREHFKNFEVVETGLMEDLENHSNEDPHTHILRYILGKKPTSNTVNG
jgi:SAM-dependent methyltransferase